MSKLAVYGTLRDGKRDTYRIKDVSLVFPSHRSYPTIISDTNGKGAVVELIDVDNADLASYDVYEGVERGLYKRKAIDVYHKNGEDVKARAWVYIAGPLLMEINDVFEEVPEQDWLSTKTRRILDLI